MHIHVARKVSYETLHDEIEKRVRDRRVKAIGDIENPNLVLYCYTNSTVYEGSWDPVVEICRGLVLDIKEKKVVATPFPKFFNYGERTLALPPEPFEVYEKLDGSLGIVFHDGRRWRAATKGSFTSPQSAWCDDQITSRPYEKLQPGSTYLFEMIYAANKIVVHYDYEGLVLLGGYDPAGVEYSKEYLDKLAVDFRATRPKVFSYRTFEDALVKKDLLGKDEEGYVVRFHAGYRVKLKGAEYLRVHRLMSNVTPLFVWDAMANGMDIQMIRKELPEEFYGDFDAIYSILLAKFNDVVSTTEREKERLADKSNKDLGLDMSQVAEVAQPFIFSARKDATWLSHPKTRASVFRTFRPTGNVLPGYKPSDRLKSITEEE